MLFFQPDNSLNDWGDRILQTTWSAFPGLGSDQIAITWVVYDEPVPVNTGGALTPAEFWKYGARGFAYRGTAPIYPASIVKLFYGVAVQEWLETGMIQPSTELDRAVRDMIVDSSNDATSLVVDVLTGTTSGPELPPAPFETWKSQRNIVNRYFQSLNWLELEGININQKTWSDGAYGREQDFLGEQRENRNRLTTNATAKLLHSIIGGVTVSSERSQSLMALMKRSLDPAELAANPDHQVTGFLGAGLPQAAQLWSKAGETSQVRHDAAYVELPDRRPYLLVVFTEGKAHAQNTAILPFVSQQIVAAIQALD
ncbi:MAG: serine hydrolase [Leptolyngbyaceae cyanobacterium CRU_2_3]|nr:serine hydrolase [Leptolyngbyaceae cyanobacterium CRU_2_3]